MNDFKPKTEFETNIMKLMKIRGWTYERINERMEQYRKEVMKAYKEVGKEYWRY